jgi:hypothetical protein
MGGSYRQCEECGKRALSIATRCPGCGREFPAPPMTPERRPTPELGRLLSARVAAGVVGVAVILTAAELVRTSEPAEPQPTLARAVLGIARLDTATAAAIPAPNAGELRVARTWTNVRASRSTRAGLEAILMPGDTVLADSLDRDWYRVALEGEVMGYAHRTTLIVPGSE